MNNGWSSYSQLVCGCTLQPCCAMNTQEYLTERMLSVMESVNWVCEEVLVEHEWVSPLTTSLKEEEEVLAELDHKIGVPCGTPEIAVVYCSLNTKCKAGR